MAYIYLLSFPQQMALPTHFPYSFPLTSQTLTLPHTNTTANLTRDSAGAAPSTPPLFFGGEASTQKYIRRLAFPIPNPRPKIRRRGSLPNPLPPAQKYIRQGAPSLSHTSAHYTYPHLFNNILVYIIKKHLQSTRRHNIIKNHSANVYIQNGGCFLIIHTWQRIHWYHQRYFLISHVYY